MRLRPARAVVTAAVTLAAVCVSLEVARPRRKRTAPAAVELSPMHGHPDQIHSGFMSAYGESEEDTEDERVRDQVDVF